MKINLGTQRHYGSNTFIPERVKETFLFPEKRISYMAKPIGGLWSSSLVNNTTEWKEWCISAAFEEESLNFFFDFVVDKSTNLFIIDSNEQYEKLINICYKSDFQLDFTYFFNKYDGLHITSKMAHRYYSYKMFPISVYDVESTVIYNPKKIILLNGSTPTHISTT